MKKAYAIVIGGIFGIVILSSAVLPIVFYQPFVWSSYTEPGIYNAEDQFGLFQAWVRMEAELWIIHSTLVPPPPDSPYRILNIDISRIFCYMSVKRVWIIDGDKTYSTIASRDHTRLPYENNVFSMTWSNCPELPSDAIVDVVAKIWIQKEIHYLIARDCPINVAI